MLALPAAAEAEVGTTLGGLAGLTECVLASSRHAAAVVAVVSGSMMTQPSVLAMKVRLETS